MTEKQTKDNGMPLDTLGEAALQWLQWKQGHVKESSFSVYEQSVRTHIIPNLGEERLTELTESKCNEFLRNEMSNGNLRTYGELSGKTISDLRSILVMILRFAGDRGHPEFYAYRLSIPQQKKNPMVILTCEEQERLERYLLEKMNPANLGIMIALYTGLRIGEICGLRWSDIDFFHETLHVQRTVIRIRKTKNGKSKTKLYIATPKTVQSFRVIPVPDNMMQLLSVYRTRGEYYVVTGTKRVMEPRTMLAKYKRILKAAGLEDYRFHTLRHSFASRCVENDFDVKSLSEIMGHANVQTTMQRYVHPSLDYKREQMNRLTFLCSSD